MRSCTLEICRNTHVLAKRHCTISHGRCTELLVSSYTNNHSNPFLGPTVGVLHTVNLCIHEKSEAKIKRERDKEKERGKESHCFQLERNLLQSKYLTQASLEKLPLFIAIKRILTDLTYQRQRI